MHARNRLLLTVCVTVALLTLQVSAASAAHIRVNNAERGIRIVWTPLTFELGEVASIVRCNTTLEGTFSTSTFAKVLFVRIGYIARAAVQATGCTGGTVRALALPWEFELYGFAGSLPAITGLGFNIKGASFSIFPTALGFECLMASGQEPIPLRVIANLTEAGGGKRRIDTVRANETSRIPLTGGPFGICGLASASLSNTGNASVLGEIAKTTVNLI